jgi:hypothetical protein
MAAPSPDAKKGRERPSVTNSPRVRCRFYRRERIKLQAPGRLAPKKRASRRDGSTETAGSLLSRRKRRPCPRYQVCGGQTILPSPAPHLPAKIKQDLTLAIANPELFAVSIKFITHRPATSNDLSLSFNPFHDVILVLSTTFLLYALYCYRFNTADTVSVCMFE